MTTSAWKGTLSVAAAFLMAGCLREELVEGTRLQLTFVQGSSVVTRDLSLKELETYGLAPVPTNWPFGKADYQGVPVQNLLEAGGRAPETSHVLFHCADGYTAHIPVGFFKRYPAAIVTRVNGKPPGRWPSHKGKPVGLYLALPNTAYPELDSPRWNGYWPFQVAGLETTRLFNRLRPAPDALSRGQELFVEQCIHCHAVGGSGGLKGPELGGLQKRRDAAFFAAYVAKPTDKNPASQMPAYGGVLGEDAIRAVYDYLASVSP